MSTNDNDEHDSGTAFALAAIGGGGVLLWLLLRGRGKGWGSRGKGNGGGVVENASSLVAPRRPLVRVRADDRVEVDGVISDLATVVTIARNAGSVSFHTTGNAREGWVSKVFHALRDAGVDLWVGSEISGQPMRFQENDKPKADNAPLKTSTINNPATRRG